MTPENEPTPPTPQLTQADIDRAVDQAKIDTHSAVLAKLGTTDLDTAAAAIKAKNDADAKNRSDIENAQAATVTAQAERDAARASVEQAAGTVNSTALDHILDLELVSNGHPADAAMLARTRRLVSIPADTPADAVLAAATAEVAKVKGEMPERFTATKSATPAPAPGISSVKPPTATGLQGKTIDQIGREAATRFGLPTRPLAQTA